MIMFVNDLIHIHDHVCNYLIHIHDHVCYFVYAFYVSQYVLLCNCYHVQVCSCRIVQVPVCSCRIVQVYI